MLADLWDFRRVMTVEFLNSYATGEVEATGVSDMGADMGAAIGNAGGLVGVAIAGLIGDCYATGQATGNDDAGGFVGQIEKNYCHFELLCDGSCKNPHGSWWIYRVLCCRHCQ